jgi:5-methylcytosine-specific restriction endonuclease McrA
MTSTQKHKIWRQKRRAQLRQQLIEILGPPKCQKCQTTEGKHEVDHIHATKVYVTMKLRLDQRLLRYVEEAKRGEVQWLCAECNRVKGVPPPPEGMTF